jgi:hypothetical protein
MAINTLNDRLRIRVNFPTISTFSGLPFARTWFASGRHEATSDIPQRGTADTSAYEHRLITDVIGADKDRLDARKIELFYGTTLMMHY